MKCIAMDTIRNDWLITSMRNPGSLLVLHIYREEATACMRPPRMNTDLQADTESSVEALTRPPSPPESPDDTAISSCIQNWFISLCLLSGSLILTLRISKIIALSLVFPSSRKPLNGLSIPLKSSLIFTPLDPLILLLCHSLNRNSFLCNSVLKQLHLPVFRLCFSVLHTQSLDLKVSVLQCLTNYLLVK